MKTTRHMHPAQVLDLQADLMVRLTNGEWLDIMRYQTAMDITRNPDRAAAIYASQIIDRLHNEVHAASAYYVDPKMTPLVEYASAGLDESDRTRMDMLPTLNGFAYFENPLTLRDIHDTTLLVNAVLWFPVRVKFKDDGKTPRNGTIVVAFNDADVTPDKVTNEIVEKGYSIGNGRWHLVGSQFVADGQTLGQTELPYGVEDETEYPDEALTTYTNITRLMHAYWLLLNQTVTDVSESEIPRVFSKRAKRMEIPDRVTIVALRRTEGHSHGETDVEWQYRWMVRGHWAWRSCSEHHEMAEPNPNGGWHARVWVRAYIKGPDDKPFHLTEKVYALVR